VNVYCFLARRHSAISSFSSCISCCFFSAILRRALAFVTNVKWLLFSHLWYNLLNSKEAKFTWIFLFFAAKKVIAQPIINWSFPESFTGVSGCCLGWHCQVPHCSWLIWVLSCCCVYAYAYSTRVNHIAPSLAALMSSPVSQTGAGVATPQAVLQSFQVSDADLLQVFLN